MEIILREDIENLGLAYDLVDVKPGYARNYLIPQGKAVLATPVEKDNLNAILDNLAKEQAAEIKEAQETLKKAENADIKITSKAGSSGKLFGSINNARIAEELANQGVEVDKKYIKVPGNNIKRAGNYTATIRLHRDVVGEVPFEIIADVEKVEKLKPSKKEKSEVSSEANTDPNSNKLSLDDVAMQALPASAREKMKKQKMEEAPSEEVLEVEVTSENNPSEE